MTEEGEGEGGRREGGGRAGHNIACVKCLTSTDLLDCCCKVLPMAPLRVPLILLPMGGGEDDGNGGEDGGKKALRAGVWLGLLPLLEGPCLVSF